jgi:glycerate-2-kinase
MDFVFMLTRSDQTVPDCLEVLDEIAPLGLTHIGFKDVGVAPDVLGELNRRIKAAGATSYMEVVSTSSEACLRSARVAREVGVDRLLGGTQVDDVLAILAGSAVRYLPFPGRPFEHPTKLAGTAAQIEADCRRFQALGCAGVDLLAYRATEADPLDLVRAARRGTDGTLLVAGSVQRAEQIRALAAAGADAFTIGSAAFDGSFAPRMGSLRSQLRAVLDACR